MSSSVMAVYDGTKYINLKTYIKVSKCTQRTQSETKNQKCVRQRGNLLWGVPIT